MGKSVFAAAYCFTRNQVGKTVATMSIDIQASRPAVADERVGAYYCPNWDEAGAAKVVFKPYRFGEPYGISGEVLMISHDGYRCVEVIGFVPRQADVCSATFESVLDDFRVHGGTYADEVVRNRFSHGAASTISLDAVFTPAA